MPTSAMLRLWQMTLAPISMSFYRLDSARSAEFRFTRRLRHRSFSECGGDHS
jgi:hypothetical protein